MIGAVLALLSLNPVGIATVGLKPLEPLPLGGYTARRDRLADPGGQTLFARAIAFPATPRPFVLVAFEGLTIPESLQSAVQTRVGPQADVLLVATHTHCAPDTQMLNDRMTFRIPGITPFSRRWLDWYSIATATSAQTALLQPVSAPLSLQKATAPINRNRRPVGQPDQTLWRVSAPGQILLDCVPAHATILGDSQNTPNGDWPGALMRRTGGLALPGPIGDASPAVSASTEAEVRRYAASLNLILTQAPVQDTLTDWLSDAEPVRLPTPVPHPEFALSNSISPELATLVIGRFAPPTAHIRALASNDTLILGIPGEPTGLFARRLSAVATQNGFKNVLILSHAGGWAGYLLTPEDYERGGYEATLSFYGPDVLDAFAAATDQLARRVRSGLTRKLRS